MKRENRMTKAEFIREIREFADNLENGTFGLVYLESGYIFGNRNYGELHLEIAKGIDVSAYLYSATDEEREEGDEE